MNAPPPLPQTMLQPDTRKHLIGFKIAVGAVAVSLLAIAIWALIPEPEPVPLPIGEWLSKDGSLWMQVKESSIRIGRNGENSTFAVLPNNANGRKVYDRDDLAKAHPQRLRALENGTVEWLREARGPSPEYNTVFLKREELKTEYGSSWSPPWEQ